MKVDKLVLYCSSCDPSRWVGLSYDEVLITLDLRRDEYVFNAICPFCKNPIENSRRAFK